MSSSFHAKYEKLSCIIFDYEPHHEKTFLCGFITGPTQTWLCIYRQLNVYLKNKLIKYLSNTNWIAFLHIQKTKAQIICASTWKLIKHWNSEISLIARHLVFEFWIFQLSFFDWNGPSKLQKLAMMKKKISYSSELLSNNSLFRGQLQRRSNHERIAWVIYLRTIHRQTVNYYSTIHAIELIYFDFNTQWTVKIHLKSSTSFNFPQLHPGNPANSWIVSHIFTCICYVFSA